MPRRCRCSPPIAHGLAEKLDQAQARAAKLETINRDVSRRLDSAIETIRAVLAADEEERLMAQVNLTVNGRVYRMACEDGEEDHVAELGQRFDAAINELRGVLGEIGDQRLMVMAGILMTDRLGDTEERLDAHGAGASDACATGAPTPRCASTDWRRILPRASTAPRRASSGSRSGCARLTATEQGDAA